MGGTWGLSIFSRLLTLSLNVVPERSEWVGPGDDAKREENTWSLGTRLALELLAILYLFAFYHNQPSAWKYVGYQIGFFFLGK